MDPNAKQARDDVLDRLVKTLGHIEQELDALYATIGKQMEGLRSRDPKRLTRTTDELAGATHRLEQLLDTRRGQTRLAARLSGRASGEDLEQFIQAMPPTDQRHRTLSGLRARVRQKSIEVERRFEDLEFALHFAAELDSDLLRTVHRAGAPSEGTVYRANGAAGQTAPTRSVVNRYG